MTDLEFPYNNIINNVEESNLKRPKLRFNTTKKKRDFSKEKRKKKIAKNSRKMNRRK